MRRFICFSMMVALSLFCIPHASADEVNSGGHFSVTSPENCAAVLGEGDKARPALHYMTHSYKRCMELSRKLMRAEKADKAKDTQDVNKNDVSYDEDLKAPKNYYRVTPREKGEKDE